MIKYSVDFVKYNYCIFNFGIKFLIKFTRKSKFIVTQN